LNIVGTFKSFKILLKNNNEKLELLNSFQKFIFDKQSAAPLIVPPGARGPKAPPCYATAALHTLNLTSWKTTLRHLTWTVHASSFCRRSTLVLLKRSCEQGERFTVLHKWIQYKEEAGLLSGQ